MITQHSSLLKSLPKWSQGIASDIINKKQLPGKDRSEPTSEELLGTQDLIFDHMLVADGRDEMKRYDEALGQPNVVLHDGVKTQTESPGDASNDTRIYTRTDVRYPNTVQLSLVEPNDYWSYFQIDRDGNDQVAVHGSAITDFFLDDINHIGPYAADGFIFRDLQPAADEPSVAK